MSEEDWVSIESYDSLWADFKALKAENERLVEAGDAMYNAAVQDSTGLWLLKPFQNWRKMNHPRSEGGAK